MELKQLQTVFDAGGLKSATVASAPMQDGYILIVKDIHKKEQMMTSQRAEKKQPRVFKSIDAAVTNAGKIDFREVKVVL